jgi:nitronate monooxygenase
MILNSSAADIVYTPAVSGIPASFLGQSLAAAGFDAERLKHRPEIDLGKELDQSESKAWRDIWSAGQGVGSITDVPGAGDLIARMKAEYDAA